MNMPAVSLFGFDNVTYCLSDEEYFAYTFALA
jgi:hypothetical protein